MRPCARVGEKCKEEKMAQWELLSIGCKPSACMVQQVVKESGAME